MTRSLSLGAAAAVAATWFAACSPPSGKECARLYDCPLASTCVEGICQAVAPSRWVYVADTGTSTITPFSIDPSTGALSPRTPIPAGSGPTGLAVPPGGRFLVVANSDAPDNIWGGAGTISVFARGAPTPSGLAEVAGSPFPANGMALNVAVTPDGRHVYTTNQLNQQLSTFAMDPSSGSLTQAPFSPLAEYEAHSIVMHPSGRFFYTGAENTEIKGRAIAADGSYTDTPNSPYASPMANNWLSITPDGSFLYSVDAGSSTTGSGNVRGFAIDQATGELSELPWSPFVIPGSQPLRNSAITPMGEFIYVGLWNANAVAAYRIDRATGELSPVAGTPFAAGTRPKSLAVDSEGRFLYVANFGSNNVSAFSIAPETGVLTPIATYPTGPGATPAGTGPKMLITAP